MVLGLAAAPACIVWDLIAHRYGDLNVLISAYLLQILGILLPLIDLSLSTTLIDAALFCATFIGIVSLVLTMAERYYPTRPAKMMGGSLLVLKLKFLEHNAKKTLSSEPAR